MFRNRGGIPNINLGRNNNENGESGRYRALHYLNYWNGQFIIIRYDKTFVAIELITIFIILLTAIAVYLFAYPVSFKDPLSTMKNNFLTAQLISIGISLVLTGIVTFFTRSSKEKLIKNLKIIAIVSILVIFAFLGIKLHIDNQYNEDTFEKFYEEYEKSKETDKDSNKIVLGATGIRILEQKEAYIEESVNAYTNFSAKTILYMIIHIVVVILIFYLSYRLSSIERKKEKLAKDDAILYDKEENVKF